MTDTERLTVEAHLNQAVRHLATARIMVDHLHGEADLSRAERLHLNDISSVVRVLSAQITSLLAGEELQRELAQLLIEADPDEGAEH